jgi:hypothetical protein
VPQHALRVLQHSVLLHAAGIPGTAEGLPKSPRF